MQLQELPAADAQMLLAKQPQQAVCGVTVDQVEVIVFNILSKLASKGNVADVLSDSTDLADVPEQQHISEEEHISDDSSGDEHPGGQFEVPGQPKQTVDDHIPMDQENGIFIQEDALRDDALLVQENGMYDDIVPNMKRNDVLVVPRQQRGHKRGRRRQQKVPLRQQPDPEIDMCFPFFRCKQELL